MAELIDEARARRAEAARLRVEASGLRFAAQQRIARTRDAMGAARAQRERARSARAAPLPSPWSGLRWQPPDEVVENALVPR